MGRETEPPAGPAAEVGPLPLSGGPGGHRFRAEAQPGEIPADAAVGLPVGRAASRRNPHRPLRLGQELHRLRLGQQACIHGYSVAYWPAAKLFEQLKLCKADGSYLRELAKKRLLVIDDFGLEVLDTAGRLFLLELLEDRHGRASTIFTSQLPVSQWHQVIGEPTIADAICDRIVHTASANARRTQNEAGARR